MKIDITSDLHFDMWVKITHPEYQQEKQFNILFEKIIPENHSEILCIAGDLGHYNQQNEFALTILKKWYKHILFVHGNHDLYLVSETQSRMYHHNSFERLNEMKELANKIEGVHFLEGNIVEIEGKKFCGTGLWYDFQYGVKNYGLTIQDLSKYWQQYMTDSRLIEVISLDSETESGMIDNISYFKSELEKLKKVYQQSDVILTHVGPDWSMIKEHHKNAGTSFFYFDGEELLQNCYGKTWLYGHTHDPVSYDKYGCKLICNPLGYPHENIVGNNMDNLNYKFKTVDI